MEAMGGSDSRAPARPSGRWPSRVLAAVVAAGLSSALSSAASVAFAEPPSASEKLRMAIDTEKVDLKAGVLEVTLSHPADRVKVEVQGDGGKILAQVERRFEGARPGTPLVVRWSTPAGEAITRIEVFGYDTRGYYQGTAITPWYVEVPHEDVVFKTGSAHIDPPEEKKLRQSLAKIRELLARAEAAQPTLFVLAHTDTVGSHEDNQALSERRARSIAGFFLAAGLPIEIRFAGAGERALAVPTADSVPEARNRRADYMLSLQPPKLAGVALRWFRPAPK